MEEIKEVKTSNRSRRRHKLRRLGNAEESNTKKPPVQRSFGQYLKRTLIGTTLIAVAIAVLLGHHYTQNNAKHRSLLQDFLSSYRKHYNQIVHGQADYCEQELGTQKLFARIRQQQILHQGDALKKLEVLLHNETKFSAIAIVGPSGVGKSLFARSLEQNFPWRENVHSYAWNTHVDQEAQKFHLLRLFVDNFSDCGRNLLVIDNLQPCDRELVTLMHDMITTQDDADEKRVLVIYIFRLNTLAHPDAYLKQFEMLQELPNTVTVNFQPFGRNELKDCIRREALLENLTLSKCAYEEIIATINPAISGCKNVHAKVLVNGERAAYARNVAYVNAILEN